MPHYLLQWTYKEEQMKAMIGKPHDRAKHAAKAIEPFGGKLHGFYFAFGKYDGIAIAEFPDNESAAASLMLIAGGGATARLNTTVLMTSTEAEHAMKKAGTTKTAYGAMPK
jgi:uncharacterized protein with GYD domain